MMELEPLVSICIPTYNRAELLVRAIESAQRQSYPRIEIIVADNSSTDDTEQVVRCLASRDSRIRYIRNKENVGPTRNWQISVDAANGMFCKILYSDDAMAPDFISKCMAEFNRGKDVGFVVVDAKTGKHLNAGKVLKACYGRGRIMQAVDFIADSLLWVNAVVSPTCALFRTSDIKGSIVKSNPCFSEDRYLLNGAGPDLLIYLNAARNHEQVAYVAEPLVLCGISSDSITLQALAVPEKKFRLEVDYAKARYQFARDVLPRRMLAMYYFYQCAILKMRYAWRREIMREGFIPCGSGWNIPSGVVSWVRPRILRMMGMRYILKKELMSAR